MLQNGDISLNLYVPIEPNTAQYDANNNLFCDTLCDTNFQ
nr:MAG TPA: hypothetical protein [Caudoviricetes sp.]